MASSMVQSGIRSKVEPSVQLVHIYYADINEKTPVRHAEYVAA